MQADILVVGGGIGGLTAALALTRDGHRVLVLEKAAQFAELGAGLQLAPNATRVLAGLGVLGRVLEAGVRPRRLLLRSALTAGELTALDLGEPFRAQVRGAVRGHAPQRPARHLVRRLPGRGGRAAGRQGRPSP